MAKNQKAGRMADYTESIECYRGKEEKDLILPGEIRGCFWGEVTPDVYLKDRLEVDRVEGHSLLEKTEGKELRTLHWSS